MAATKVPPVVRPMDPTWLYKFMSDRQIDQMIIDKIVKALKEYNKACAKAAKTLNSELENIQGQLRGKQ